jgi:hypothetical protein
VLLNSRLYGSSYQPNRNQTVVLVLREMTMRGDASRSRHLSVLGSLFENLLADPFEILNQLTLYLNYIGYLSAVLT